jgi:hypothetical protein
VNQGLAGGPGHECPNHVGIRDIEQRVALLGEVLDVLAKSFPWLLLAILEILWVPGAFLSALDVSHEDFPQVRPAVNPVDCQVLEPCPCRVGQGQGQVADDEVVIDRSSSPASEPVVLEPQGGIRLPSVPRDVCRGSLPCWEQCAADARAENPRTRRVGARALVLTAVMAFATTRVISSPRRRLLILMLEPPAVDGVACVAVGVEASLNEGVRGTFPLAWGLVDRHIVDTLPRRGMRACILPASPRHQALGLLLRRALDERAQPLVSTSPTLGALPARPR